MGGVVPDRFFWALPPGEDEEGDETIEEALSRRRDRSRRLAQCPLIDAAVRARPEGHPRRRQFAGARVPRRRRHAALHRPRRGRLHRRRRRQALRRLHRLVGADDPRPRPSGGARGRAASAARDGFSFGAPTEREVELAEEIIRHVPSVEQVRLVSSGTEACMSAIRLARARHRALAPDQVRGLLPRPRRRAARQGRLRPGHLRPSDLAPACRPRSCSTRPVLDFNNVAQLEEAFAPYGDELACVIIEPIAGNMNFVRTSVPFMKRLRELCHQHGALLIMDEVMTGFRVALGGAQSLYAQRDPGLRARHQRVRQGHRRRHAAGGLRRVAQDHGAARAAGPGLPGGHAVGQPGGHRLRPGHAARDRQARLPRGARRAHARAGRRPEGRGRRRRHRR